MSGTLNYAAIALAKTTGFSLEERQIVLGLLKGITARSEPVGGLYAAVLARLGARDFGWPEFDRWQAIFAEQWKFPPLWDELKKAPTLRASLEIRHAYQEHKLYLLLHWLQSLETTRAQTRTALARYGSRGLRARIARQGDSAPCPVCDPLNHHDVRDNPQNLPPFHPGCRCLVLAITDVSRPNRKPVRPSPTSNGRPRAG
ncbi:MAG: hypothetical protein HY724_03920 [Candidatus Rokubacteria bacterium]|nr:hypothetical protein [Candidatus Rokubacteria bacterium]